MMKRKFTRRETLLLLVCLVLFVAIFYYEFFYLPTQDTIASYSTTDLQDEIDTETSKATAITSMKAAIAKGQTNETGVIEPYNNLNNEVAAVGEIFTGRADNMSLTWANPTVSDTTVRRVVSATFRTNSYSNLLTILQQITNCKYRCILQDVTITSAAAQAGTGIQTSSDINVSLKVTFFETTVDATSTEGLTADTTSK